MRKWSRVPANAAPPHLAENWIVPPGATFRPEPLRNFDPGNPLPKPWKGTKIQFGTYVGTLVNKKTGESLGPIRAEFISDFHALRFAEHEVWALQAESPVAVLAFDLTEYAVQFAMVTPSTASEVTLCVATE